MTLIINSYLDNNVIKVFSSKLDMSLTETNKLIEVL